MMQIRKIIPIAIICIFVLILFINIASAPTAIYAEIYTADIHGNKKIKFNLGETVYIHWKADGTVDIRAYYKATNALDGEWLEQPLTGIIEYVPTKGVGLYEIKCTGAESVLIAYGTFFVIPELVFGTIAAIAASFGAFGLMEWRKRKK